MNWTSGFYIQLSKKKKEFHTKKLRPELLHMLTALACSKMPPVDNTGVLSIFVSVKVCRRQTDSGVDSPLSEKQGRLPVKVVTNTDAAAREAKQRGCLCVQ